MHIIFMIVLTNPARAGSLMSVISSAERSFT